MLPTQPFTPEQQGEYEAYTKYAFLEAARDPSSVADHRSRFAGYFAREDLGVEGPFFQCALSLDEYRHRMAHWGQVELDGEVIKLTDAGERELEQLRCRFGDVLRTPSPQTVEAVAATAEQLRIPCGDALPSEG